MLDHFLTSVHPLLVQNQQTTLLAVSGGVDSIVLCHLFYRANLPFAMAHCNFQMRGESSDQAEQLVQQVAADYQVPCYTQRFETREDAKAKKVSIQMAARGLRYDFFNKLLRVHQLAQLATAHHWDDSVETILLNLIRGTGIDGLTGISPSQGKVIRPLLFARKKEIIDYAHTHQLAWQEDDSNQTPHYKRNRVRHELLPLIRTMNPNFETTLRASSDRLRAVALLSQQTAHQAAATLLSKKGMVIYLDLGQLKQAKAPLDLAMQLLAPYGFSFHQVAQIWRSHPVVGKKWISRTHCLYIDRSHWLIEPIDREKMAPFLLCVGQSACFDSLGKEWNLEVMAATQDCLLNQGAYQAALDYHQLQFPLTIRLWEGGDYLYPLGMRGKKKVSDLLTEQKIPLPLKKSVVVVVSGGEIVWVVGHRLSEPFKVAQTTTQVAQLSCSFKASNRYF